MPALGFSGEKLLVIVLFRVPLLIACSILCLPPENGTYIGVTRELHRTNVIGVSVHSNP